MFALLQGSVSIIQLIKTYLQLLCTVKKGGHQHSQTIYLRNTTSKLAKVGIEPVAAG